MQNRIIIATAAALFAASAFAAKAQTSSSPSGSGMTSKDCKGVNACKGQNACEGQGWVSVGSAIECTVLQSK